jgi:hypothetical protein
MLVRSGGPPAGMATKVLRVSVFSSILYAVVARCEDAMNSHAYRRVAVLGYVLASMALFACYAVVLRETRRGQTPATKALLVGMPLVFQVGWWLLPPVLSIDLFSYLADGGLWQLGLNPYTHAAREIGATPFGARLAWYGWRPVHGISPYGPIWIAIEAAIGRVNMSVAAAVLALKALVMVASALTAAIVYATVKASGVYRARLPVAGVWQRDYHPIQRRPCGH